MVAMQYSFSLPADYDMGIIQKRIADNGHMMDSYPHLLFKAYLYACRGKESQENLYAPFYLWEDSEGMNSFLGGSGFAGLSQSFGWPSIKTWSVWTAHLLPGMEEAKHATKDVNMISPFAELDLVAEEEALLIEQNMNSGAIATVSAFEPTTWTRVCLSLWRTEPEQIPGRQIYKVGHLSIP